MIQCNMCGCKFDEKTIKPCNCCCGCGGANTPCPRCGYEIRLPKDKRPKNLKSNSIFGSLKNMFNKNH